MAHTLPFVIYAMLCYALFFKVIRDMAANQKLITDTSWTRIQSPSDRATCTHQIYRHILLHFTKVIYTDYQTPFNSFSLD